MTRDNVLCENWYLLGEKRISSHANKTGSWYIRGLLFKISGEHPCPFYMGFPPPREMKSFISLTEVFKCRKKMWKTIEDNVFFRKLHSLAGC